MVSTVQAGLQAGQIALAIQTLQAQVTQLQDAISRGDTITSIVATIQSTSGAVGQLQASQPLNAADSLSVFNNVLSIYNNALAALNAQLTGIT